MAEKIYTATGWTGVICGGKGEQELGQRLIKLSGAPLNNMTSRTSLSEMVNVIGRAQLLVANETGSVHIAVAIRTPVITIAGGGHYGRFVPYQIEEKGTMCQLPIVVIHKMPCFECNWQCIYKTGKDAPFPCIKSITVDDVWTQVHTLIEQISAKQGSKRSYE